MRLQEAAVLQGRKSPMRLLRGITEASFYPWREHRQGAGIRIPEHQRADYLLHPRRAALWGGRNDDVVFARHVAAPVAAVDDPRSVFAQCRPNEHGAPFSTFMHSPADFVTRAQAQHLRANSNFRE